MENLEPQEDGRIKPVAVARDVAIIWVLTLIGGFLVGLSGAQVGSPRFMAAIVVSNLLLGTIGFVIAGCLAPGNRWKHLFVVALGAWLTSLVNVLLTGIPLGQWAVGLIPMMMMMGLGGAVSYLFRRK